MNSTRTRTTGAVIGHLEEDAVFRKISWRIMPLVLFAYVFAFLDRINIGYAQLQMKQDLAFTDAVYGLGAGIFFITYLLFEVPSNLLLEKIGARLTFCESRCSGVSRLPQRRSSSHRGSSMESA
jgi:sugar phosphate permease